MYITNSSKKIQGKAYNSNKFQRKVAFGDVGYLQTAANTTLREQEKHDLIYEKLFNVMLNAFQGSSFKKSARSSSVMQRKVETRQVVTCRRKPTRSLKRTSNERRLRVKSNKMAVARQEMDIRGLLVKGSKMKKKKNSIIDVCYGESNRKTQHKKTQQNISAPSPTHNLKRDQLGFQAALNYTKYQPDYEVATRWEGSKPFYCFRRGSKGLGYYKDPIQMKKRGHDINRIVQDGEGVKTERVISQLLDFSIRPHSMRVTGQNRRYIQPNESRRPSTQRHSRAYKPGLMKSTKPTAGIFLPFGRLRKKKKNKSFRDKTQRHSLAYSQLSDAWLDHILSRKTKPNDMNDKEKARSKIDATRAFTLQVKEMYEKNHGGKINPKNSKKDTSNFDESNIVSRFPNTRHFLPKRRLTL